MKFDNIFIFSGAEYGTTEAGWKAVLVESDRRCDLHMRVKDDLHSNVINQLKQWQKDNYHKVSNDRSSTQYLATPHI